MSASPSCRQPGGRRRRICLRGAGGGHLGHIRSRRTPSREQSRKRVQAGCDRARDRHPHEHGVGIRLHLHQGDELRLGQHSPRQRQCAGEPCGLFSFPRALGTRAEPTAPPRKTRPRLLAQMRFPVSDVGRPSSSAVARSAAANDKLLLPFLRDARLAFPLLSVALEVVEGWTNPETRAQEDGLVVTLRRKKGLSEIVFVVSKQSAFHEASDRRNGAPRAHPEQVRETAPSGDARAVQERHCARKASAHDLIPSLWRALRVNIKSASFLCI